MDPRPIRILALTTLLFAACASDDGVTQPPEPPPPPHEGTDLVSFSVYSAPAAKREMVLRWKGNGAGPAPDSPEQTDRPFVGYAQPFRVEWVADFEQAPVAGYRVRVSQIPNGPFLPRDADDNSIFGDLTSWLFHNAVSAESLAGEDCPEGEDCAGMLRFDSGSYRMEMIAQSTEGALSDRDLGLLEFDINYPPVSSLVIDPVECGDGAGFPQYIYTPSGGDPIVCGFAPGDTIPMGATVRFRVAGQDRLPGRTFEDGLCCDVRLDLEDPEIRHQARLSLSAINESGDPMARETVFSPVEIEDVFQLEIGPFDYILYGRAVDEHGRRDPDSATLSLVGGFHPRIVSITPSQGEQLILRDPKAPGPWPSSEIDYDVETGLVRYWAMPTRRYLNAPNDNTMQVAGAWFRFSVSMAGASHPQEPPPGGVRSWAYELIGEFDPLNTIQNGGGFDRLGSYSDSEELNRWELAGDDRVAVWVPSLFWTNPELLDPDGDCPAPEWCDVGEDLRTYLGTYVFRARGRSTRGADVFEQGSPEVVADTAPRTPIELIDLGRRTEILEGSFAIRLGLDDGNGNLTTVWPSP